MFRIEIWVAMKIIMEQFYQELMFYNRAKVFNPISDFP